MEDCPGSQVPGAYELVGRNREGQGTREKATTVRRKRTCWMTDASSDNDKLTDACGDSRYMTRQLITLEVTDVQIPRT